MNKERLLNSIAFASEIADDTKNIMQDRIDNFVGEIKEHRYDSTVFKTYISEKECYIVIRGSVNWKDVLTDIKFPPDECPEIFKDVKDYICVHKGFAEYYLAARDAILHIVTNNVHKQIILVGHSLGGAACRLAHIDVRLNYKLNNLECCVFGCPKLGNKNFEKLFSERTDNFWSFKNRNDIVPNVPLAFWGFAKHSRIHVKSKDHNWWAWVPGLGNWMDHQQYRYEQAMLSYVNSNYIPSDEPIPENELPVTFATRMSKLWDGNTNLLEPNTEYTLTSHYVLLGINMFLPRGTRFVTNNDGLFEIVTNNNRQPTMIFSLPKELLI